MTAIAKTAVQLDVNTGGYKAQMDQAADATKSATTDMQQSLATIKDISLFSGVANIAGTAASGVASFAGKVKDVAGSVYESVMTQVESVNNIATMSAQTGLSSEFLSFLEYVASINKTNIDETIESFARFAKTLGDEGYTGDMQEALFSVIGQLRQIPEGAQRAAAASHYFGESWMKMGALFKLTDEQWASLYNEAVRFGVIVPQAVTDGVAAAYDELYKIESRITGLKNVAIEAGLPYVQSALEGIAGFMDESGINAATLKDSLSVLPDIMESAIQKASVLLPKIESLAAAGVNLAGTGGGILGGLGDIGGMFTNMVGGLTDFAYGIWQGLLGHNDEPAADMAYARAWEKIDKANPLDLRNWSIQGAASDIIDSTLKPLAEGLESGAASRAIVGIAKSAAKDKEPPPVLVPVELLVDREGRVAERGRRIEYYQRKHREAMGYPEPGAEGAARRERLAADAAAASKTGDATRLLEAINNGISGLRVDLRGGLPVPVAVLQ